MERWWRMVGQAGGGRDGKRGSVVRRGEENRKCV